MNPQDRLKALLADGRALSMVLVYQSRTGKVRGYRIFCCDGPNHRTTDVTPLVCKVMGVTWNNERGTIDSNEPYRAQDSIELSRHLTTALNAQSAVPVLIL